jgi:hypothetical protein
MPKKYKIIFQSFDQDDPNTILTEKTLLEDTINAPTNCLDFSIGHTKQITLIQNSQDIILNEKAKLLNKEVDTCPDCKSSLIKFGNQNSTFYDVFTSHKVKIQRLKCSNCKYETKSTVRTLLGTTLSGDLQKIQATLGATFTYRESEQILELFSTEDRAINNHDRIKHVTENIGNVVAQTSKVEKDIITADEAEELILNVDGGHVNTIENKRSVEAIASVIYRPGSLKSNKKETRNYLSSKNCAASVCDDNQEQIISGTIIAALKQGLTKNTHVTALCDGANNCWSVVDAFKPICKEVLCILDWFHLAMKIENISLPEQLKDKLIKIKWHLWRGNVERALIRLEQLKALAKNEKHINRINKFTIYINNNKDRIVDYRNRKKKGLVFTSNLAESTIESLINRRCKGQQHMRWSRDGLNPILQLRAAINSKDEWQAKWRTAILNAA